MQGCMQCFIFSAYEHTVYNCITVVAILFPTMTKRALKKNDYSEGEGAMHDDIDLARIVPGY